MNQFTTFRDFYIGVFTQSGPKAAGRTFPFVPVYFHFSDAVRNKCP